MQTQQAKLTTCILFAFATIAFAGCGSHNPADTKATSTATSQQEQTIQQNAAKQNAAAQTAPQMGTAPAGK